MVLAGLWEAGRDLEMRKELVGKLSFLDRLAFVLDEIEPLFFVFWWTLAWRLRSSDLRGNRIGSDSSLFLSIYNKATKFWKLPDTHFAIEDSFLSDFLYIMVLYNMAFYLCEKMIF